MGYEMSSIRKSGFFSTNISGWEYLFKTAQECGWIPQGTELDIDHDWELQNYLHSGTLDDDAKKKLEEDFLERKSKWRGFYFYNAFQVVTDEDAANMMKALKSGQIPEDIESENYVFMREFIDFLENGAFIIY